MLISGHLQTVKILISHHQRLGLGLLLRVSARVSGYGLRLELTFRVTVNVQGYCLGLGLRTLILLREQ